MEISREDFRRTIDSLNIQDERLFQPKCIYLPKIAEADCPPEMDFSLPVCVTHEAARYVRRMLRIVNYETSEPSRDGVFMHGFPGVGKSTILYLLACVAWAKGYFFAYINDGDDWVKSGSPYLYFIQLTKRLNSPEILKKRLGEITYKHLTEHLDERYDDLAAEIFLRFRYTMDVLLLDNGNTVMNRAKSRVPYLVYRSFTQVAGNFLIWSGYIAVAATKTGLPNFIPQIEDSSLAAQIQPVEEEEFDCVADAILGLPSGGGDVIDDTNNRWAACVALQEAGGVIEIAKQAVQDLDKVEEIDKVEESYNCSWPVIKSIIKSVHRQFDKILTKYWTERFHKRPEWEITSFARELHRYLELSDEQRELNYLYLSDLFDLGILRERPDNKGRTRQVFLCTTALWSLQNLVREDLRQQSVVLDQTFHGDDEFKAKILCSVEENGITVAKQLSGKVTDIQSKHLGLHLTAPEMTFRVCTGGEQNPQLYMQTDNWRFVRMCLEFHPKVTIALYPSAFSLKLWDVTLLHKTQEVEGTDTPSYTICFFHVTANGTEDLNELESGGTEAGRVILEQLFPKSQFVVKGEGIELISHGTKTTEIQIRFFLVSAVKMMETSFGNLEIISGDCVKKVFEVDVDNAALAYACRNGQETCVKLMIEGGADVNTTDKRGNKVLLYASENGCESAVNILLHAGAHVNHTNKVGSGALKAAVTNGHDRVASLLIQAGADVNKERTDGRRPLSEAVRYGRVESVKLLLNAGATVNEVLGYPPPCRNRSQIQEILDYIEVTKEIKLNLKHFCREAIRTHLLGLGCLNLLALIPMLSLPGHLCDYLMYGDKMFNGDDNENYDINDGDNDYEDDADFIY